MRYSKPATSVAAQERLLARRGLKCSTPGLLELWLKTVGYYRLSAYWLPFESPANQSQTRSKKFVPGTQFEDVVRLYIFDRHLRLLVTEAIERIEIALRARWTNRLSLAVGSHGFMDASNFVDGYRHTNQYNRLVTRVRDSRETFIEHYHQKYTDPYIPPIWSVTETLTFGELSHWIVMTKDNSIRSAVAIDIGLPNKATLDGCLHVLSYIRNICAHHGRLWNRKTVKRLPAIKRFKQDLVYETGPKSRGQLTNRTYNVLVLLMRLMKHQSADTTFPRRCYELVSTLSRSERQAMGFPADWRNRPIWHEAARSHSRVSSLLRRFRNFVGK